MQALPTTAGRSQPIRLADIPLKIRRRFGAPLIKAADMDADILLALDLTRAVEHPSDKVYWVPAAAVKRVLG